jgi:hypothetical protein
MPATWVPPGGHPRRPQDRMALPNEGDVLGADSRSFGQALLLRVEYVGLLILLLWATAYVVTFPEFSTSGVRVTGNRIASTDRIERAAGVSGRNVFLVNTAEAEESIQRETPVHNLAINYAWPNQVTIDVVEYLPAYTWQTGGIRYSLADSGLVFALADQSGGPIIISDLDNRPVAIGERQSKDVLATVGYLQRALPPMGLEIALFERSDSLGVVAAIVSGPRIAFGDSADLPAKSAALRAVIALPEYKSASPPYADVRVPSHPFWR